MSSKKLLKLLAAMALAPALARAAPPTLVDATGVKKSVVSTIVIPVPVVGLTASNVTSIIENYQYVNGGASSIPPGYSEVQVAMGPHSIGDGGGALGLVYYQGLGYGVGAVSGGQDPRGGNLTSPPRVVGNGAYEYCSGGDSGGGCGPVPASWFVCEPVGTRYSLKKDVGGQLLNVSRPMLDLKTLYPAIGMSTNGATAYCQSQGYTNYTPGTIVATQPGSCGQQITRWNGSAFYNDNACYNNVMQSLQCFK